MRLQFKKVGRVKPPELEARDSNGDPKAFKVEAPPELPRTITQSIFRKALPWIMVAAIIGIVVMLFVTGAGVMRNPMMMVFMGMMVISMFGIFGQQGPADKTPDEVDSDRVEYLRHISLTANNIRHTADKQRLNALWSHPDPKDLGMWLGTRRMWERDARDPDFLQIRIGLDTVKLANPITVKHFESELDAEPVSRVALHHLQTVQQSVQNCPKALDLKGFRRITIYGDQSMFRAAMRSWIGQLTTWHAPIFAAVAVAADDLEERWGWAKWLPHAESSAVDGAGYARYLATSVADLAKALEPLSAPADDTALRKHVMVVVDDDHADANAIKKLGGQDNVTVIAYRSGLPSRDYAASDDELVLRLDRDVDGIAYFDNWVNFGWRLFCETPDLAEVPVMRHLARTLAQWDPNPDTGADDSAATRGLLSLLGITNAARLNVEELWAPRPWEEQLKVPVGLQPDGAPIYLDIKDEAEGGDGPHGLLIGMTGSGKTTFLRALIFMLLTRHSPLVLRMVLADFKGEAGVDEFAGYPQVAGVISDMEDKKAHVDRLGDTLHGLMDQVQGQLRAAGRQIKGAAFESVAEYEAARATETGKHLPPIPTTFVVVDEFTLLLMQQPEMAEVFDVVTRKGRSLRITFLFASQTLDVGKIKQIEDNTQYRIGMKVAKTQTSRTVIGTEDAYHIPPGKDFKGTGFLVRAPGADPLKFRGWRLPSIYEPPKTVSVKVIDADPRPRLFTAGRVEPDESTVIETVVDEGSAIPGPPRSLILTVGPQLAAYAEQQNMVTPQVWSPPLDDVIPLDAIVDESAKAATAGLWWPLGEIDQPRLLRHTPLTYNVADDGNVVIIGGSRSGKSTAVQTFILSAATHHSPRKVGFYVLNHSGSPLSAIRDLVHVGAVAGDGHKELSERIMGDFETLHAGRRRLFDSHGGLSMEEFRRRRAQGDPTLDDGYPDDVYLVVDNWEKFLTKNTSQIQMKNPQAKKIEQLADAASHGIHVVITCSTTMMMPTQLTNVLKTRWELKMADPVQSQVKAQGRKMRRPTEDIPANQPGRGITQHGDHLRFAVGRMDGKLSIDDLDEQIRQTVSTLNTQHQGVEVPAPKLLPPEVYAADLGQDKLVGEQIAIGLRGSDLNPLVIDFHEWPLLGVYGDSGKGRSEFLRHIIRTVIDRREKLSDALVCTFDIRRKLLDETSRFTPDHDYFETDINMISHRVAQIAHLLSDRVPPDGLTWEEKKTWRFDGPLVYLIVDDLDSIPASTLRNQNGTQIPTAVWAPLIPYLSIARDVGLRVIAARRANGVATEEISPNTIVGQFSQLKANRILLSSSTKDKVAGTTFEVLTEGRGLMVSTNDADDGYIQLPLVGPVNAAATP
ncbi:MULTISPECIES: type VII secretion protein EccCa [Mycobacteroides]|uniref:FtsK domain-containing protein n=1 Tax=Mycobacteroides immunogenum TaxID=83262 RepID=A0A179VCG2_9MYCO|nr:MULTISPECIES: type VII secretion protein EccCa [Mycobacteroides]OAT69317.1 hypothetical protein AWB85_21365 [Mycobacteroides immunogenum]SKT85217.1 cell division protein FtsK [Mycobacteroides abscessus subsp. massiliense]SKU05566.1 cell division protein FtsK [Mycobacteroides abscessus subsp. massiliense]